jgi:hypothetical protein
MEAASSVGRSADPAVARGQEDLSLAVSRACCGAIFTFVYTVCIRKQKPAFAHLVDSWLCFVVV